MKRKLFRINNKLKPSFLWLAYVFPSRIKRTLSYNLLWLAFFMPYCLTVVSIFKVKLPVPKITSYGSRGSYPLTSSNYFEPSAKHVLLSENYSLDTYKWKESDNSLRKNIIVFDRFNNLFFQINRIGLKGGSLPENSETKKVAVWGDSVVFGVSRGWVELASDEKFFFLSGGIEGASANNILAYAQTINTSEFFDLNILSLGWHSKHSLIEIWKVLKAANKLANLCLMTIPTSLSPQLAKKDLNNYFIDSNDINHAYMFWGSTIYSKRTAKNLVRQINHQNTLTRAFARKNNVPLLDLAEIFSQEQDLESFRKYFFDLGHPRPQIYPYLGACLNKFASMYL